MTRINNIVNNIQTEAATANTLTALTLSKSIEQLGVGGVRVFANTAMLLSSTTPVSNGDVVYLQAEEQAFYRLNDTWYDFARNGIPLFGAGDGAAGRLGDGTTSSRIAPIPVATSITNWVNVAAGYTHSLGVTSSGIAWAWGSNNYGQLGDNTLVSRLSPVTVSGNITNWTQVSAGQRHSVGLTSSGIALAWGQNSAGQLGDNTTTSRRSPVSVVGGITNWSKVSAGKYHTLGLTRSGIVWSWGTNSLGNLGDGTTTNRSSPVTPGLGGASCSDITAGGNHSFALFNTGTFLYCWGYNYNGQLGVNNTASALNPIGVSGSLTWSVAAAGDRHSLGISTDGRAWGWGRNSYGQLGINNAVNVSSPALIAGGITNWRSVFAPSTGNHSIGITSDGRAFGWGYGSTGRLLTGDALTRSSPVSIWNNASPWRQAAPGGRHTLIF